MNMDAPRAAHTGVHAADDEAHSQQWQLVKTREQVRRAERVRKADTTDGVTEEHTQKWLACP